MNTHLLRAENCCCTAQAGNILEVALLTTPQSSDVRAFLLWAVKDGTPAVTFLFWVWSQV